VAFALPVACDTGTGGDEALSGDGSCVTDSRGSCEAARSRAMPDATVGEFVAVDSGDFNASTAADELLLLLLPLVLLLVLLLVLPLVLLLVLLLTLLEPLEPAALQLRVPLPAPPPMSLLSRFTTRALLPSVAVSCDGITSMVAGALASPG
jgi:hypothetical protein